VLFTGNAVATSPVDGSVLLGVLNLDRAQAVSLYGYRGEEREAFVRACAEGEQPRGIPEAAAALITRHARQAVVMNEFSRKFQEEGRLTPCPPLYGEVTDRQVTA